ncbi:MAG: nuclear transport factor 2 family protein [Pyrinomonadaceae bacterium]
MTGVYRIDIPASDRLYTVVAGASSNLPFGEQQRFFIDLAVRLTPPDLLAIEQQGTRISLGSSRAPRMTFVADGVAHNTRAGDGHVIHVRLALQRSGGSERLIFTSSGRTEDNFSVEFATIDNGKRLSVVRRIAAEGLDRPLVIRTVYNKISDVAHWELYGDTHVATASQTPNSPSPSNSSATKPNPSGPSTNAASIKVPSGTRVSATDPSAAHVLRNALDSWIAATNNRDINQQMSFYVPRLKRFYLMSNASRTFVREEKARVFTTASVIDIRAQEPEIIFQDGGRTAVMRYRKQFRIENGRNSRRGEVIQELRWQRVGNEWRIFSERDIRVLK